MATCQGASLCSITNPKSRLNRALEILPSIYHFDNLNYHRSLYDNRSNTLSVQFHNCLPKHLKVWSRSVDANEPRDGDIENQEFLPCQDSFPVYDNRPNTPSEQFQNYLPNCLEVQSHSVDVSGPPDEDHFLNFAEAEIVVKFLQISKN
uniref:Uncharacterized protein n=1 Tax=Glossina pallidipes TaxID=7398 RepID=A0A1A9ZHK9_GLOPL